MAKGYSKDLRARAVALVEDGESRREAARVLGLGASTAIRWMERWPTTGSVAACPARATVARRSRRIANGCLIWSQRSRT
jgi:transposase